MFVLYHLKIYKLDLTFSYTICFTFTTHILYAHNHLIQNIKELDLILK